MTLEFIPEIEESLKSRYSKALKTISGKFNPEKPSENFRDHIFDFFDGLRLVVSKEHVNLCDMLHYVASIHSPMDFDDPVEFAAFVLEHINILRDKPVTGMVNITYKRGVLYMSVPERGNPILN
jgi:hypothetical protein